MQDDRYGIPYLMPQDPPPFEAVNPSGASPVFLTCEHAGRGVPRRIGDLGVAPADMDRHIAWDVGADGLARALSQALDAPLVLQPHSRLVIDCNRPFEAAGCVPEASDGTAIPANAGLGEAERRRRFEEIHQPFHAEICRQLDRRGHSILVAVHSFTPKLATSGRHRPWHAGLLFNRDDRLARRLMRTLQGRAADRLLAFNEPYCVDDLSDYTIPVHGEGRGIPHVLLEIRSDEIADHAGQARWAALLAAALQDIVTDGDIAP